MTQTEAGAASVLTSGRRLAQNTLWGLGASVGSIAIALFCVPIMLKYLGTARFGVIALVWIVEGQFGIFNAGLSSALTKLVAEKLGTSKQEEIPAIFWTAFLAMGALGGVGAVILRVSSPWLVFHALKVPASIQGETITAFHLVAISLPAVISTAALRGFLAAHQRFDLLSAVRLPLSIFSYLVPLLVLPFSRKLGPFILVLIIARLLAWVVHLILCFRVSPALLRRVTTAGAPLGYMFRFGGWMTVTNVVSPIMVNLDRVLIGGMISVAAVAYYATPYEAATKLWIIPSAISGVLFPAFATALGHDRQRATLLFERGVKYIFLSLFPIVVGVLAAGQFGLRVWLGPTFAEKSALVLSFLVIGVFANSLAQIPFWCIQAAGRPDWPAKVHLVELPCYLLVFWVLTKAHGIDGAGLAWMLRTSADCGIMFWLSTRLQPENKPAVRHLVLICSVASPFFVAAALLKGSSLVFVFVLAVWVAFAAVAWFWLLTTQERDVARNPVRFLLVKRQAAISSVQNY